MKVVGAPSSAPGEKITKKLEVRLRQSTCRRLVIRAVTGTPWMSKVSVSPSPTPSSRAISSSTEIRGSRAASAAVHQRPATSRLCPGGSAAHVSTYSRVRAQVSSRRVLPPGVGAAPLTAASRERTTGVSAAGASAPWPATRAANGAAWSGWMSMKKNAGAWPGRESTSSERRFRSSSAIETTSITARPSDTSTGPAWLPGRCRLAAPCFQAGARQRTRRASAMTPRAPRARSSSAPPRPPANSAPIFQEPACQSASAASPPAIGTAAAHGRRPSSRGSTSWRRISAGGTRRIWSSGQSA